MAWLSRTPSKHAGPQGHVVERPCHRPRGRCFYRRAAFHPIAPTPGAPGTPGFAAPDADRVFSPSCESCPFAFLCRRQGFLQAVKQTRYSAAKAALICSLNGTAEVLPLHVSAPEARVRAGMGMTGAEARWYSGAEAPSLLWGWMAWLKAMPLHISVPEVGVPAG